MNPRTVQQVRAARRSSIPLIAIQTADPVATEAAIIESYRDAAKAPPILQWDVHRGMLAANPAGREALAAILPKPEPGFPALPGVNPTVNPTEALAKARELPEGAILFLHNAHRLLSGAAEQSGANYPPIQAIANLRDLYKSTQRTLILLAPIFQLPRELVQDVLLIDEPLPTDAEIRAIITRELQNFREAKPDTPEPSAETLSAAVDALTGLAPFPAEQATAMSLASTGGLDVPQLWERKRSLIRQTRGLSVDPIEGTTFADLGGMQELIGFGRALFAGNAAPKVIVRIEEIEKMIAGAGGGGASDGTGVSQDQLGTVLITMEDEGWDGMILVGPPGAGKSEYSKTLGRTFGRPTITLDLGAVKSRYVGDSEENIRAAMKVIKSIAGSGAYFVTTSNGIDVVPDSLRRRFTDGIWFTDLPDADERAAIWRIMLRRYNLPEQPMPDDSGWTGAEIRNCAKRAARFGCTLADAARWILPVSVSSRESIERLRASAHGKYLSASYPGPYRQDAKVDVPKNLRKYVES